MEERRQQVGTPQTATAFQLSPETKIIDVFTREDVGERLLILGEPGSGKTITLLKLAEQLIEQAEAQIINTARVPIIFELSTWKNDQQFLEQWLIEQLKSNYGIDKKVSKKLLKNNRVVPLLDGLDELGLPRQRSAIDAINEYLHQNISCSMVICCRWEEYRQGKKKLHRLHGAYYLQPSGDEEIRDYLKHCNKQELWFKIDKNPLMKELAQKPLFLNLMIEAFKGEAILSEEKLFEEYIKQKLNPDNHEPKKYLQDESKKYPQCIPYTEEMTRHWLSYLARHLESDNLTVFYIEKMQPYWLEPGRERLAFRLIYGLTFGLMTGLNLGGFLGLILGVFLDLMTGLVVGLMVGFMTGLIVGIIWGLIFWDFREYKIQAEAFVLSYKAINKEIIKKLISWIIFGLISGLILALSLRETWGLIEGLILGETSGLTLGIVWGLTTELKTREIPNQGIKEAWKNFLIIPFLSLPLFLLISFLISLFMGVTFPWQKSIGLGIGVAITISFLTGGQDWIQHLALRLILWLRRKIPWDYAKFLEYAVERRLLQKTGGSYRFFHNSLRKYFCGNTPLPSHTIERTKNKWVGFLILFFTLFSLTILRESIYVIDSSKVSLLTSILQTNEITLLDIISDHWRNYQRGDVIEFWIKELAKEGDDADSRYIMRIIALPGETLEIKQGKVYINDQLLSADYLDNLSNPDYKYYKKIPADYYVVMGKKMDKKQERLVLSLVHKDQIVSRIIYRLWPLERLGSVE